jgi:hypothetical protein
LAEWIIAAALKAAGRDSPVRSNRTDAAGS